MQSRQSRSVHTKSNKLLKSLIKVSVVIAIMGAGFAKRLEEAAPMPRHGRYEPFTLQLPREFDAAEARLRGSINARHEPPVEPMQAATPGLTRFARSAQPSPHVETLPPPSELQSRSGGVADVASPPPPAFASNVPRQSRGPFGQIPQNVFGSPLPNASAVRHVSASGLQARCALTASGIVICMLEDTVP